MPALLHKISTRSHNSDPESTPHPLIQHAQTRASRWLMHDSPELTAEIQGPHGRNNTHHGHPWWKVMCLSGVDYFSTLGYQPALAALAAGLLAPLATLILVAVTLLAALPIYRRIAQESPRGAGSIHLLECLLSKWNAKIFVLILLGFTITDFVITITLSAADAAAHLEANPLVAPALGDHHMVLTLGLLALLTAVFLRGFNETINVAVVLVAIFILLNLLVIGASFIEILHTPHITGNWWYALTAQNGNPWLALALVVLIFPKIALGLSGFETGVVVMPQIGSKKCSETDQGDLRIRGAKKLLTTAALTMSVLLICSSFATTLLIPQEEFKEGGDANGRALAYLAHDLLGEGWGTAYDISTILILWFAGASAMAGLLNLVPRYLPRYGMAPEWTRASRPLVLVFSAVCVFVTLIFDADVEAQGGAYATGVLVLMTSAAVAVTLSAKKRRQRAAFLYYLSATLIFGYTTIANIFERPDGLRISLFFIGGVVSLSLLSRALRSYELRIDSVNFDPSALALLACSSKPLHLIAHLPDNFNAADYREKLSRERWAHHLEDDARIIFVEIAVEDPSNFSSELMVHGLHEGGYQVLSASGSSVANSIAALSLAVRDITGQVPHIYLDWAAGSPLKNYIAFVLFGQGQIASTVHEVLRRAEKTLQHRPVVHVS